MSPDDHTEVDRPTALKRTKPQAEVDRRICEIAELERVAALGLPKALRQAKDALRKRHEHLLD